MRRNHIKNFVFYEKADFSNCKIMNLVKSLYYFIYMDVSLLISFRRVDAEHFNFKSEIKEIMNSLRPPTEATIATLRARRRFTWFHEKDYRKVVTRFDQAWNFLYNRINNYYSTNPDRSRIVAEIIKEILVEEWLPTPRSYVMDLCKEASAEYCNEAAADIQSDFVHYMVNI